MTKSALQSTLTSLLQSVADLDQLQTFGDERAKQLEQDRAVLTLADLQDRNRLQRIIEAEAVVALIPKVMAARTAAFGIAEKNLLDSTNEFISSSHGPRVRDLSGRAAAKVRKELQTHFTNPAQLDNAVAASALVVEANNLGVAIASDPAGGVIQFVQRVLALSGKADAFEKKL